MAADMTRCPRFSRLSNRPWGQALSDYPPLQCRCSAHGLALLFGIGRIQCAVRVRLLRQKITASDLPNFGAPLWASRFVGPPIHG